MIADKLRKLNSNNVTDCTLNQLFFNPSVKRSISQNKANHNFTVILVCGGNQFPCLLFIYGKGLFKQNIKAVFKKRNCGFNVDIIHCAVDCRICKAGNGYKLFHTFKAMLFGNIKSFGNVFSADAVGVNDTHNLHFFRLQLSKRSINQASVTSADNNCFQWIHTALSFLTDKTVVNVRVFALFNRENINKAYCTAEHQQSVR